MKILRRLLVPLLVLCSAVPAVAQDAPAGEPTATSFVQERADAVLEIVNTAAADPAALDAKREELRVALRAFLSFEVLAERTLGDHWESRTPEEQTQFVNLLRDLIETSYCRSLGTADVDASQYAVAYTGERSRRSRTTVEATVTVDGGEHFLEVKLDSADSGYIVYDLVTDDVSLEESYAESFENIISEDGWGGLIERMEERLAEMQEEL